MSGGSRVLAGAATAAALLALVAGGSPATDAEPTEAAVASDGPSGDFARLVPIGGGRRIHLECRGTGSPTVVLVSGARGAADEWASTMDPAHPAAGLKPSPSAVLATVASFTRVCAYDRPGTTRLDGKPSPSTPVPQPTTAEIRSAPPMPHPLPAAVLTADKPWNLKVGDSGSTWPAWLAAQDDLARELHARHITDTRSGHGIAVEQPRLVADAVHEVVDEARKQ
ncbi:hypothetical protein [Streptomyces sp. NBC_00069]|uniref:hypothetical protein n=1 Tax=Streptomyces sp. NBC_00069 TaxID=2975639 RepID=UPI00324D48A7